MQIGGLIVLSVCAGIIIYIIDAIEPNRCPECFKIYQSTSEPIKVCTARKSVDVYSDYPQWGHERGEKLRTLREGEAAVRAREGQLAFAGYATKLEFPDGVTGWVPWDSIWCERKK